MARMVEVGILTPKKLSGLKDEERASSRDVVTGKGGSGGSGRNRTLEAVQEVAIEWTQEWHRNGTGMGNGSGTVLEHSFWQSGG